MAVIVKAGRITGTAIAAAETAIADVQTVLLHIE